MRKISYSFLILLMAVLVLGSCFGRGSGSKSGGKQEMISLSGRVSNADGANVSLYCSGKYYYGQKTDFKGAFEIPGVPKSQDLTKCFLRSNGGLDGASKLLPMRVFLASNKTQGLEVDLYTSLAQSGVRLLPNAKDPLQRQKYSKILLTLLSTPALSGKNLTNSALDGLDLERISAEKLRALGFADAQKLKDKLDFYLSAPSYAKIQEKDLKEGIEASLADLYKTHKISCSDEICKKTVSDNLAFVAAKITDALQDGAGYHAVNKFKLRKALSQMDLAALFKDDGSLIKALADKLKDANLKQTLADVSLDIKNIDGLIIQNVEKDDKILHTNQEIIEYYTFSNVSFVAKMMELTADTYDDSVLDPIFSDIALALARLGFFKEAVDTVKDDIFSTSHKLNALVSLGNIFVLNAQNALAKRALDLAMESFIGYVRAVGAMHISAGDFNTVLAILKLRYAINDEPGQKQTLEFLDKISAKIVTDSTAYGRLVVAFRDTVKELLQAGEMERAKKVFLEASNFVRKTPADDAGQGVLNAYLFLKQAALFAAGEGGEFKAQGELLVNYAKSIDTLGMWAGYYDYFLDAFNHLTDKQKLKEALDGFASTPSLDDSSNLNDDKTKEWYLIRGLATAMVLDGKTKQAVDYLTQYFPGKYLVKDGEKAPDVLRYYASFEEYGDLDTAASLLAINKSKLIEFIKELFSNIKAGRSNVTWKPREVEKDGDLQEIFFNKDHGLNTLIYYALKARDKSLAQEIYAYALSVLDEINAPLYKLTGYYNLFSYLGADFDADFGALKPKLEDLINRLNLTASSNSYKDGVANLVFLSKFFAKKRLEALVRLINDKIKAGLNFSAGDIESVKLLVNTALGEIDLSARNDKFERGLLSALIANKDKAGAKDLLRLVSQAVEKLPQTLDKNQILVVLARSWGSLNEPGMVKNVAEKITTVKERNQALYFASRALGAYDDFPYTNAAFLDTDGDSRPDFFNPLSKDTGGLNADDDIDGDGIPNKDDNLPYFKGTK